ncbi:MAG TPA: hypothetical protein VLS45_06500 [Methylomicrobium sp.]|nr:hypothetical protein [Methylomicrobium sp.]
MALLQATYPIAPKGLATSYEETSLPPDFALKFRNRFINAAGGGEKRRGISRFGGGVLPGSPDITALHELVKNDGTTVLMASGEGHIFRFDTTASSWSTAYSSGFKEIVHQSAQMVDRLIFVNGTSRPIFTEDGVTFEELHAILHEGRMASPTSANGFFDTESGVNLQLFGMAPNDVVMNLTRGKLAYVATIVTANSTANATTTSLISGQSVNDRYRVIDTVELNIIPTTGQPDNISTISAVCGASNSKLLISSLTSPYSQGMRLGDFIINTTRTKVYQATAFAGRWVHCATNDVVSGITGTSAAAAVTGDSVTLHKSAMPIPDRVHVHYGRAYFIDSRARHLIRISGPDDPTDMTTQAGTEDARTFSFGSQQPTGDIIQTMASYQRFLVMAGSRNTLLFDGTNPIKDATSDVKDFDPVGLFPQGAKSSEALATIGNDAVIISDDGIQAFSLQGDASTLGQENLSEALKTTLRDLIAATSAANIKVFHYQRRSWVCFKIGSEIYVYNYTPYFGQSSTTPQLAFSPLPQQQRGSWSLFDGPFAQQNAYLVRQNGTLICAGAGGKVYNFDNSGIFDDDGTSYSTEYQPGWLTLDEPRRSMQIKQGHYIRPAFNTGEPTVYTITAESPFQPESRDTVMVTAGKGTNSIGSAIIGQAVIGGGAISDKKFALRWRGKEVRITFSTNDTAGPDVLSRFTLYATRHGLR